MHQSPSPDRSPASRAANGSSPTRYRAGTSSSDALIRGLPDISRLPELDAGVSVTHFGARSRSVLESILVPVSGGPNSGAAVDVALALARYWSASLRLMTVVSSGEGAARMEADTRLHNYTDDIDTVPFDICVRTREDVMVAITDAAGDHDLTVIGESERSLFRRLFTGTIPERLAERSETPLLVVERDTQEPTR